jgi:hypothetical protein
MDEADSLERNRRKAQKRSRVETAPPPAHSIMEPVIAFCGAERGSEVARIPRGNRPDPGPRWV